MQSVNFLLVANFRTVLRLFNQLEYDFSDTLESQMGDEFEDDFEDEFEEEFEDELEDEFEALWI